MDKEEIRQAILEMLGEDESMKSGKRFFFPENVEAGYNVIQGLTLSSLIKFIAPTTFLSVIILFIPPYSSVFLWIIKCIIVCLFLTTGFILAILRPIKYRNNIKCLDYIKTRILFVSRQKMYYLKPKDRRLM